MSRTSTNTVKKTATKALNGGDYDREDVEAQVEALREDVAQLTAILTGVGASKAEELKSKVSGIAKEISETSTEKLENAQKELASMRGTLETQVKEKPLQSLGVAMGVGVLAALLMRRAA